MQVHDLERSMLSQLLKIGLLAIIVLNALPALAGIGMGEWQLRTPGGNTIDNYSSRDSGFALFMSNEHKYERVENMERWYFYKQHIIGQQNSGFFIADEKQIMVQYFKNKDTWEKALKAQGLTALIWTRWHDGNWNIFDSSNSFFWLFSYGPIAFIGLLILIGVSVDVLKKNKLNFRKPAVLRLSGFFLMLAVYCLLQFYPQSL